MPYTTTTSITMVQLVEEDWPSWTRAPLFVQSTGVSQAALLRTSYKHGFFLSGQVMAMVTPVNGLATILLDCSYCGVYKVGMLHALTGSYVQSSQVVYPCMLDRGSTW